MTQNIHDLLKSGIAAVKAGERVRARQLLMQVVEQDETNVSGWLWLSGVADTLENRLVCLENVLALDPDNAAAKKGGVRATQKTGSAAIVVGHRRSQIWRARACPRSVDAGC